MQHESPDRDATTATATETSRIKAGGPWCVTSETPGRCGIPIRTRQRSLDWRPNRGNGWPISAPASVLARCSPPVAVPTWWRLNPPRICGECWVCDGWPSGHWHASRSSTEQPRRPVLHRARSMVCGRSTPCTTGPISIPRLANWLGSCAQDLERSGSHRRGLETSRLIAKTHRVSSRLAR